MYSSSLTPLDAPLPAAADLQGFKVATLDEGEDLRGACGELLGDLRDGEKARTGMLSRRVRVVTCGTGLELNHFPY
jgi:hypothetical protein